MGKAGFVLIFCVFYLLKDRVKVNVGAFIWTHMVLDSVFFICWKDCVKLTIGAFIWGKSVTVSRSLDFQCIRTSSQNKVLWKTTSTFKNTYWHKHLHHTVSLSVLNIVKASVRTAREVDLCLLIWRQDFICFTSRAEKCYIYGRYSILDIVCIQV